MPFIPTPSAAKVEVRCLLDSQQVENVFWFIKNAFSGVDLQNLVDAIESQFVLSILPLLSNQLTYNKTYARGMRTESDIEKQAIGESGAVGDQTTQNLPNNVSFSCELQTGKTGRANRGRNYVLGLAESLVSGNLIDPSLILSYLTALAGIGTAADAVGWDWVVVSQYSGVDAEGKPIPRAAGIPSLIESVSKADNVVDSQRRRLPGRGR